jgi:hypothetical protein
MYRKNKDKNASLKGLPRACYNARKMREELGIVTQPRDVFLVCFRTKIEQHFPLYQRESAKSSKLLLAGNAAKHTKMSRKIMFLHINFLHKNFIKVE